MILGKGTICISQDGGETWQDMGLGLFEIDEAGVEKTAVVKEPSALAVLCFPNRMGMTMSMQMLGDWERKVAEFMPAALPPPLSLSYTPAKKKKAQWKQSPLSRYSR